ncbi:hypothetical protein LTR24_006401 [Lithohypha guttulata]|uniref:Protochlorophyllide reductase n=1 Tax=Lithohypha guttulata TaxID=1690604 RepID=A0ABR0K634_9EURO|nr:hypothetical protein LTR24_006401 [Lithohypha guttulata]
MIPDRASFAYGANHKSWTPCGACFQCALGTKLHLDELGRDSKVNPIERYDQKGSDGFLNRSYDIYKFDPKTSIPDLSGKTIVVTGGNAGLGFHSILQLAQHNPHRIYLTARSQAKYDSAMVEIRKQIPTANNMIRFIQMDLASLASTKQAAEQILADASRLDILINNAGIMGAAAALSPDGYEIHFATNHMGHALFTKLLMPLLLQTAKTTTSDVRIVNVSSGAYMLADSKTGFDENLVKTDMASFSGSSGNMLSRYGQSKLANVLHAKALAKHYPTITSVAIAPGRVKTALLDGMYKDGRDKAYAYFQRVYDFVVGALTPEVGAYTQVWAATDSKDHVKTGVMYNPVGKEDGGNKFSKDEKMVDRLWEFTESELQKLGY